MLAVARYYINDLQHAEDVLMTAFFKAFTRLNQFKNDFNFEGWLRKIIVNEALSFLRKNNKLIYTDTEVLLEQSEINDSQIEEVCDEIQLWIDQLPENQKVVFTLYAVEGYSHKEIAQTLGIPVGTSKSYLSRARLKLQKKINNSYLKKMKKHKVDLIIKEKLESQQIKPSAELWESIADKLEEQQEKTTYRMQKWGVAAVVVIALGLGIFFNMQTTSMPILENEEITFEEPLKKATQNSPDPKPLIQEENPLIPKKEFNALRQESPLYFIEFKNITPFQVVPSANHSAIQVALEAKANKIDWSTSLEDSLLDLEVDSLMNLALNQLKLNKTENARRKELALSLLLAVEDELNSEILFKYKVLDIIKSSYSKVNIVLNESSSTKTQNNEN